MKKSEKELQAIEWICSQPNDVPIFYGITKKEIFDYMNNKKIMEKEWQN